MNRLGDINPNYTPTEALGIQQPPDPVRRPKVADVVRLQSGGCMMTLIDIEDPADDPDRRHLPAESPVNFDPDATVVWTTPDGQGGQLVVPISCLVKVDLAEEEAELAPLRRRSTPVTMPIPGTGGPR